MQEVFKKTSISIAPNLMKANETHKSLALLSQTAHAKAAAFVGANLLKDDSAIHLGGFQ